MAPARGLQATLVVCGHQGEVAFALRRIHHVEAPARPWRPGTHVPDGFILPARHATGTSNKKDSANEPQPDLQLAPEALEGVEAMRDGVLLGRSELRHRLARSVRGQEQRIIAKAVVTTAFVANDTLAITIADHDFYA